jgi:MFS superfamily sulfate permease-like transporter
MQRGNGMPVTKQQKFIFTLIMAAFMVGCMALYNSFLRIGFVPEAVSAAAMKGIKEYVLAVPVAFFIGSRAALYLAKRYAAKKIPSAFPYFVSFFTVLVMVPMMTTIVYIMNMGLAIELPALFHNMVRNYAFAWPIQIIIVGPLVRYIFSCICPPQKA